LNSEIHGKHTFRPFEGKPTAFYPLLQSLKLAPVVNNPADAAGHYEYIICVNKAINQGVVAKSLTPMVDNTTTIVLIQNGVGNEDPFRAQFPNCTILSCVVCSRKNLLPFPETSRLTGHRHGSEQHRHPQE
jgi:ketopantoate reductase